MTFDDPGVMVMGKEPILHGDGILGYVTRGNFGNTVQRSIIYG
jgi:glycine cleavage system aminomethyltransferase T